MPIVKMPDGTQVRFPDEMPREQIRGMIASKFPDVAGGAQAQAQPESGGYGQQIFSGLLEGATGALGAPVDLVNNFVVKPAVSGVNAVFGTDLKASETPLGGSSGLRQGLAIAPQSDNGGEKFARRVAQSVGGAVVPAAGTARTAGQAASALATGLGGGIGGAAAEAAFPNNPWASMAGDLLGGVTTGGAIARVANNSARKAAEKAVPTVQELKQQAGDKFENARSSGVVASQQQTQQLAKDFRDIAEREGLIYPDGTISTSYPKAAEALKMTNAYSKGTMTVPQMQTVRKTLADAAANPDAAERRMATAMLKKFDDFTSPLSPDLAQGRALYTRAMRGEQLETLRDLAEANRSKYSASGVENALRNEYRNLNRRIIRGTERGWSPDMQAAIRKVDEGTTLSNAARNVGRMAPTGPMTFMSSVGAPGLIGTMLGGPVAGATAATGAAMTGYAGRAAATKMGIDNAILAELMARNGGPINVQSNPELLGGILGALMASQAAEQSTKER